jgi:uncharacterized protein (UPF0333 family)
MIISLIALVAAYFVYVSAAAQKKGSFIQKAGKLLALVLVLAAIAAAYFCIQGCLSGTCPMMHSLKK